MGTRTTSSPTNDHQQLPRTRLRVLYDFEYETKGSRIRITKDESLLLLNKTNKDWWQVVRPDDCPSGSGFYIPEHSTFYVPTGYVAEEPQLPEGTRFYVDKDKMFKQNNEDKDKDEGQSHKRGAHDSFRNVIRKLSGNSDKESSKPVKAAKPPKGKRKNSMESGEDIKSSCSGIVSKNKDMWEHSAFGMCFGRDNKNVDAQVLNPFQEELENALSNRQSQRRTIIETKLPANKQEDQVCEVKEEQSKFESIQSKWEKVSASVLKRPEIQRKIKEDSQKVVQSVATNSNVQNKSETKEKTIEIKRLSEGTVDKLYSKVEKIQKQLPKQEVASKPLETNKAKDETESSNNEVDILINDKRKMWAIETLMSELLQSSSHGKEITSKNSNESSISGPNKLAQELHDMNASRRFENAEIQVNLLDDEDTKENKQCNGNKPNKVSSFKRKKAFDFPHVSSKPPISPTARSPKLLDEYNEANILNDKVADVIDYHETPCYSNVSLRLKREKVPCKLKMPTRDFREELQLTPSLEKLASEIKFLPANSIDDSENDKHSLDMDYPATTLSQDSLRLYKRRSKSDGALNRHQYDQRRRDSSASSITIKPKIISISHMEISNANDNYYHQRRYNNYNNNINNNNQNLQQRIGFINIPMQSNSNYQLDRKSKSMGDLDCDDELNEDQKQAACASYERESKRRYKPVPKLRSKESLRRMKPSLYTPTVSNERLPIKPVPAKRRIHPAPTPPPPPVHHHLDSSYDDLSTEIDLDRSTAVGFKALLRTPDSGSEECLQYKPFPNRRSSVTPTSGYNLSRSLSDEAVLSSASASPASRLNDGSLENLVDLPPGWTQGYDSIAKRICFFNERGDKWFSSNDAEGKIYFFEENSNESSWALPPVVNENRVRTISNSDWPQLFDGNMCILKEGVINKTKITAENGKKLRKAWSTSYAVLTELFLLFFKDAKTFASMKMDQSATAKPDISVDLNGAFIESAEKLSNRKNVYLINTLLGLQVLIQSDNALVISEWYREIHDAIQRLPFSQEYGKSTSARV